MPLYISNTEVQVDSSYAKVGFLNKSWFFDTYHFENYDTKNPKSYFLAINKHNFKVDADLHFWIAIA